MENTNNEEVNAAADPQEWWYASGPVSTMRGHTSMAPVGMMCCSHEDRPAIKRVQGETDSFGAEYFGACQECLDELAKDDGTYTGTCDWCEAESDKLRETRDYEEGMSGPVYDVCPGCRQKQNDAAAAELAEYDNRDEDDYGTDGDEPDEPEHPVPYEDHNGYISTNAERKLPGLYFFARTYPCGVRHHMMQVTVSIEDPYIAVKLLRENKAGVRQTLMHVVHELYTDQMYQRHDGKEVLPWDENIGDRLLINFIHEVACKLRPYDQQRKINHAVGDRSLLAAVVMRYKTKNRKITYPVQAWPFP